MRERVVVWVLRVVVVALALTVPLVDSALDGLNDASRVVVSIVLWTLWAGALLCILVPSSSSLTALRLMVPAHGATTLMIVIAHGELDAWNLLAVSLAIVVTVATMSGDIGRHWVQLSAYGDERRYLLACPTAMIMAQVLTWMVWFALGGSAVIALTADNPSAMATVLGIVAAVLTVAGLGILPRRFHRFTRRWLVWVPAGLVVHDHVVLAETAMVSKRAITGVDLWHPGDEPEPLDVTGGPPRPGIAISLQEAETMILAPTKDHPGGHALHVRSFLVRPTRLQPALAELTSRLRSR
ncbi:MAG: hypothetical protein ACO3SP_01605 [Ilumatobacteraceae bacterium]